MQQFAASSLCNYTNSENTATAIQPPTIFLHTQMYTTMGRDSRTQPPALGNLVIEQRTSPIARMYHTYLSVSQSKHAHGYRQSCRFTPCITSHRANLYMPACYVEVIPRARKVIVCIMRQVTLVSLRVLRLSRSSCVQGPSFSHETQTPEPGC